MLGQRRYVAPDEPLVKELVEIAFQPKWDLVQQMTSQVQGRVLAIGTREIDARVLLQQGAFTIHSDDQDLADVSFQHPPPFWRRAFRVQGTAKPHLRDVLRKLGIYESTLFPDLSTLAKELKTRAFLPPVP
jgi:hypothetical protein